MLPLLDLASLLNNARDQFLDNVDAKQIASKARHECIISEEHETRIIEAQSTKAANEVLFTHLLQQTTQPRLKKLCSIMISAKAYARMSEFGQKLLDKVSTYC